MAIAINQMAPLVSTQASHNNKSATTTSNTLTFFIEQELTGFVVTVDTTGVTLYGEWSTTVTFDTTGRRNGLLLQDESGAAIVGGSNPTLIEIAFNVSITTNGVINNDAYVLTIFLILIQQFVYMQK